MSDIVFLLAAAQLMTIGLVLFLKKRVSEHKTFLRMQSDSNTQTIISTMKSIINDNYISHDHKLSRNYHEFKALLTQIESMLLEVKQQRAAPAPRPVIQGKKPANRKPRTDEQKKMASEKRKKWWDEQKRKEGGIALPEALATLQPSEIVKVDLA